jgi:hypothetical protein
MPPRNSMTSLPGDRKYFLEMSGTMTEWSGVADNKCSIIYFN